jgi:hypothetical protein
MSRRLIILALAIFVGMTSYAFAEVQNVKVYGDINVEAVGRDGFDLQNLQTLDRQRLFLSQIRVGIDADLTDNVAATIRLINERSWTTETNASTDIDLDLGYITLKEFLYSPLTLVVGRQELRFGNALIVGRNNTYNTAVLNGVPWDLSVRKAFDAIRATLNYDPLVIDLVYALLSNNNTTASDETALYGINASYDVNKKLNIQPYFWAKTDKAAANLATQNTDGKRNKTYTLGALVTAKPVTDLNASAEAAYQWGNRQGSTLNELKREAWAFQTLADYTFSKVKFTPMIGAGWMYLSGDKKKLGWDPMYQDDRLSLSNIAYAIFPFTNLNTFNLKGSIKPMDDLTLTANYANYFQAAKTNVVTNQYTNLNMTKNNKKNLGSEVDLGLNYDYTEDVQLGLNWGWFLRGDAIRDGSDASQLIGSMKVTF